MAGEVRGKKLEARAQRFGLWLALGLEVGLATSLRRFLPVGLLTAIIAK